MTDPQFTVPEEFSTNPSLFWSKVEKADGCWIWKGATEGKPRYGKITRGNKKYKAHRIAYALTHGSFPVAASVCHHCDNPPCVRPDHLFVGTHQDNMRDMSKKGRHRSITSPETIVRGNAHPSRMRPETRPRGEQVYCAKLTEAQVLEIRHRYAEGAAKRALAHEYGVSGWTIKKIVERQTWKHI